MWPRILFYRLYIYICLFYLLSYLVLHFVFRFIIFVHFYLFSLLSYWAHLQTQIQAQNSCLKTGPSGPLTQHNRATPSNPTLLGPNSQASLPSLATEGLRLAWSFLSLLQSAPVRGPSKSLFSHTKPCMAPSREFPLSHKSWLVWPWSCRHA